MLQAIDDGSLGGDGDAETKRFKRYSVISLIGIAVTVTAEVLSSE